MKIAHVFSLIEPVGGVHIPYKHVEGLRAAGHEVDVWAGGWHNEYPDGHDFAKDRSSIKLFQSDKLDPHALDDYDLIVGNGIGGTSNMMRLSNPRQVWFLQGFDPYVFGPDPGLDQIYRKAGKILTYCHALKPIFEKYYGPQDFSFCSNGTEYEDISQYQKTEFIGSKRICFTVVYYRPLKGPKLASQVFEEMRRRGWTTVEVNIVGGPTQHSDEYHRNPPFPKKCKTVAGCDVSLHPSVFETWGLVPMESMALGTPVVGIDSIGIREYANGGNSVLIENRDPKVISDAVEALCMDLPRYRSIQRAGIETAKAHEWSKVMGGIVKTYEDIAKSFR